MAKPLGHSQRHGVRECDLRAVEPDHGSGTDEFKQGACAMLITFLGEWDRASNGS